MLPVIAYSAQLSFVDSAVSVYTKLKSENKKDLLKTQLLRKERTLLMNS